MTQTATIIITVMSTILVEVILLDIIALMIGVVMLGVCVGECANFKTKEK